jgi:hypothetical protein
MKHPDRGWIVCSLAAVLGTAGGTASADAPAGAVTRPGSGAILRA